MFEDQEYPWTDLKYEKKIHRLAYFFIIWFNKAYVNFNEIQTNIIEYFNSYQIPNDIFFITYDNKNTNTDEIYIMVLNYLSELNKKILINNIDDNIKKMEVIKQIFLTNLNTFVHHEPQINDITESGIEQVPYLKKYLKLVLKIL